MSERFGVAVAIVSSSCGAGAAVATRYLIGAADPFTLAAIRFGGGVLCLLPLVLLLPVRWPPRQDWPAVAGLGLMFYAVFFVFYNVALGYTTVARGTLALSTLPLMTMLVGAVLGIEALSARKTVGVLVAMLGVAVALASGLGACARRSLARRPHHGGRDPVHGDLQRVLAPLHRPLQRPGVSDHGDGGRRRRAGRDQRALRRAGADRQVRRRRGHRRALSCRRRRRARLLPVGVCPAAREPHPRRQHHGRQPAGRRAARRRSSSTSRSRSTWWWASLPSSPASGSPPRRAAASRG